VILLDEERERDWYGNKELFEMIQGLKGDLQETRTAVQRYNNIRKELNNVMLRVAVIENEKETKDKIGKAVRDWGGWIVAILSLVITILIVSGVV
jgi:hypothetical protein